MDNFWRRLGPSRGPSWVDPATNFTNLPDISSKEDADAILMGRAPPDYFLTLTHELTHHWCFHSPVGVAIALIDKRAQARTRHLRAFKAKTNCAELEFDIGHDAMRSKVVSAILKPIVEGLALFAEYDVVSKSGYLYTRPIHHAMWFTRSLIALELGKMGALAMQRGLDTLEFNANSHLLYARTSTEGLRRKTNLLCSPLDPAKSPYLAGYLTIKALWLNHLKRSEEFKSSEFFISFFRDYFFNDLKLVSLIVGNKEANDQDPHRSAESIASYLHDRISLAFWGDLSRIVNSWAHDRSETDMEEWDHPGIVHNHSRQCIEFKYEKLFNMSEMRTSVRSDFGSLHSLLEWFAPMSSDTKQVADDKRNALNSLKFRDTFRVFSIDSTIVKSNSGNICGMIWKNGIIESLAPFDLEVDVKAELVGEVSGRNLVLRILYFQQGQLVASSPVEPETLENSQIRNYLNLNEIIENINKDNNILKEDEYGFEYGFLKFLFSGTDKYLENMLRRIYLPACSFIAPGEAWESRLQDLFDMGFFEIFGGDEELLNAVALASMTLQNLEQYSYICEDVKKFHSNIARAGEALANVQRERGLKLMTSEPIFSFI